MRIMICGNINFIEKMKKIKSSLERKGHKVILPKIIKPGIGELMKVNKKEAFRMKRKLMTWCYNHIKQVDAILVVNYNRGKIKNMVGGDSFLEMGIAFNYNKKIFLLNPIPKGLIYTKEIKTIRPIIINRDLEKIK